MELNINKKSNIAAESALKMTKEEKEYFDNLYQMLGITASEVINRYIIWAKNYPERFKECVQKQILPKKLMGKIGNPLFKRKDTVGFFLKMNNDDEEEAFFKGKVEIVDSCGTFEQNEEPSYDVMVEDFNNTGAPCLVKHVRESEIVTYISG